MISELAELASKYPQLVQPLVLGVGFIVGLAAVVARGIVRERLRSRRFGYQVRRLARRQYVYEEQSEHGRLEQLSLLREALASVGLIRSRLTEANRHISFRTERIGATKTIQLPDQTKWDEEVPSWAQGRRAEIVERISQSLGIGC